MIRLRNRQLFFLHVFDWQPTHFVALKSVSGLKCLNGPQHIQHKTHCNHTRADVNVELLKKQKKKVKNI